jgi:uncharacterized protein YjbI with pentapeptide repeats
MGYILKDELDQFLNNAKKEMKQLYEKIKQHPLTCLICIIVIIIALLSLIVLPYWRVTQFGITNPKDFADAENSYRATIAQILGGIAVAIGIYFTRAVDQLGNPSIEIRLGGIYALERIANESDKDYWPIMEILTAYVRKNSPYEKIEGKDIDYNPFYDVINKKEDSIVKKKPFDIQAILNVIGRRKYSPYSGETECLDLSKTNLSEYNLIGAHLEKADLQEANLQEAKLRYANLVGAYLKDANIQGASLDNVFLNDAFLKRAKLQWAELWSAVLKNANLQEANLKNAFLHGVNFENADLGNDTDYNPNFWGLDLASGANLEDAHLSKANLKKSNLKWANLKGAVFNDANFEGANLEGADLEGANLNGAKNLTVNQLSKVKTLYNAKLDEELEKPLREKYPDLFKEPKAKF